MSWDALIGWQNYRAPAYEYANQSLSELQTFTVNPREHHCRTSQTSYQNYNSGGVNFNVKVYIANKKNNTVIKLPNNWWCQSIHNYGSCGTTYERQSTQINANQALK